MSTQWKWQRAMIFATVLVGAVTSITAMASCNGTTAVIHYCLDAGTSDGGDGGGGGNDGYHDPYCY
jgi:hypothetical protein